MDFTSVVHADRDIRVGLDVQHKNVTSGSETANTQRRVDSVRPEAKKPDVSAAISALNKKNSWKQESVSDKVAQRSTLRSNETELQTQVREKLELEAEELRDEQLQEARDKAKEVIESLNLKQVALRFDTAEDYNDARVITVVDTKSNEVIRQIPSEEFLRVSAAIAEYEQRMAHDEMTSDPSLKALGVDSKNVNESLRGAVFETTA